MSLLRHQWMGQALMYLASTDDQCTAFQKANLEPFRVTLALWSAGRGDSNGRNIMITVTPDNCLVRSVHLEVPEAMARSRLKDLRLTTASRASGHSVKATARSYIVEQAHFKSNAQSRNNGIAL